MNIKSNSGKFVGAGIFSAVAASLCCITPALAFISGAGGLASSFSWMQPARPYLLCLTVAVLAIAWYHKLKPRLAEEAHCDCNGDDKKTFLQTKTFLGMVTVIAVLMMAFPGYAHFFYPSIDKKEVITFRASDAHKVAFEIEGMTCNACAAHIENDVNKLPGIVSVDASYEEGISKVEFDQSKVSLAQIEEAINSTGYLIINTKEN